MVKDNTERHKNLLKTCHTLTLKKWTIPLQADPVEANDWMTDTQRHVVQPLSHFLHRKKRNVMGLCPYNYSC